MVSLSKRYRTARDTADLSQTYPLDKAIEIIGRFPKAKFDETVELSAHLGVDPRQSTQMVRGVVTLPKGSGKKVRLIAFTDQAAAAKEAGADEAGLDDLIARITEGWTDFDVAVATPAAMKDVRKVARVLGPRGLMPNPKSGTVSDDLVAVIKEVKLGGRVEYKMDKTANLGCIVGKRSFAPGDLAENAQTVIDSIGRARPEAFKGGRFIKSMTLTTTMSPGVKLDPAIFNQF